MGPVLAQGGRPIFFVSILRRMDMGIHEEITCPVCGSEFVAKTGRQVYCSKGCRLENARRARKKKHFCRNESCKREFIKTGPRQIWCSVECRNSSEQYLEYNRKKQARWRAADPERARNINRRSYRKMMEELARDPEKRETRLAIRRKMAKIRRSQIAKEKR